MESASSAPSPGRNQAAPLVGCAVVAVLRTLLRLAPSLAPRPGYGPPALEP